MKPGSGSLPFFGVRPSLVERRRHRAEPATMSSGRLCFDDLVAGHDAHGLRRPRALHPDLPVHVQGQVLHRRRLHRDKDGYYWITGRVDDVLNVAGHRLGTAEIEGAIVQHDAAAEAAVVGYPHDIKGHGVYAFVLLNAGYDGSPEIAKQLRDAVRKDISAIATPDKIQFVDGAAEDTLGQDHAPHPAQDRRGRTGERRRRDDARGPGRGGGHHQGDGRRPLGDERSHVSMLIAASERGSSDASHAWKHVRERSVPAAPWNAGMTAVLPPPGEKAAAVQRMFDRIAPSYDRVNRMMTFGMDQRWRRALLAQLGIRDGDVVLDLATGTGDFAQMVCRTAAGRVVALDFSRGMLLEARQRFEDRAVLVQGDGLRLPLADASIDVAVSGFALRNFSSIPPVLAELARVVKPGGRIGLLEVDRPRSRLVRAGHALYFDRIVPVLGGLLSHDRQAYQYLPKSAIYLPEERELVRMLQEAGFHRIQKERPMFGAIQALRAVRK